MKSNYKRLGDYIREVKGRNSELKASKLLGINIDKFFMPSVANIVGTDMSVYKIVKNGQFACNRMHVGRDFRLPVALSKSDEDFMISPAYDVFEVIDTDILLPEYLMMWFSRKEFDRNAWFYTDADVRGGLAWKAFCDMQLPVPQITKQQEIVREYHVLLDRIALNKQLIQKLEETAQTIYKQWFVDFEFPNENGLPYKSNGGEMVESELGEIPLGWEIMPIGDVVETVGGGTPSTDEIDYWDNGSILWYSPTDVTKSNSIFSNKTEKKITPIGLQKSSAKVFPPNSLLMTSRATVGKLTINTIEATTNQGFITLLQTEKISTYFLFDWIKTQLEIINSLATGSTFPEISKSDFRNLLILIPEVPILVKYNKMIKVIFDKIRFRNEENEILDKFRHLLLTKLSTQ